MLLSLQLLARASSVQAMGQQFYQNPKEDERQDRQPDRYQQAFASHECIL